MKCRVLEPFKVSGSKGIMEFQPGQEVILPEEIAQILLSLSKIAPIEKGAYRAYSTILNAYAWIVKGRKELQALRASQDISEPVYTADELIMLRGIDKDALEAIKNVKNIFELSTVEEVILGDSGK